MTRQPRVIIVILNWNGKQDTAECLDSLSQITYQNYAIVVVDNGSTDGSAEFLKERYCDVEIIETNENIGFGAGNNFGMKRALDMEADYILFLNNDTVVDKRFLDCLVQEAERDRSIGFVGPKIFRFYSHEAEEYVVWKAFTWKKMRLDATQRITLLHSAGGSFNPWLGKMRHRGAAEFDVGQYDERQIVDFVEASCVLVRKEVVEKIGGLDATYFAYVEDVDWCLRGQRAGYVTTYVPQAKIWHKGGQSSVHHTKVYCATRNRLWMMQKNVTKLQYITFLLSFLLISAPLSVIIKAAYQEERGALKPFAKGIISGLRTAPRNSFKFG